MASRLKLERAAHKLSLFAKSLGRKPFALDSSGYSLYRLDSKLVCHILDTRDDALMAAACLFIEEGKEVFYA